MLYEFDHQQIETTAAALLSGAAATTTDEFLMERMKQGDESALAALHQRHSGILRTVISRVVHNDADVDDLLQEMLMETWTRCQTYDETKGKVLGWLITMARRRAIDRVRRRQAYGRAEERLRLHCETGADDCHTHVEEDVMNSERAEIMKRLMDSLPVAQREAVQLAFYSGLSQREIAAKTGIPLGTIKTRLELAIRKLRGAVLAMGVESSLATI